MRPKPATLHRILRPASGHRALRGLLGGALLLTGLIVPAEALSNEAAAQGIEVGEVDLELWTSQRLGSTLSAVAGDLTGGRTILPQQLVLALGIAEVATEVAPESAEAWRRLLDVATVLRDEVPEADAAARRAVEALVRLDPDDAVMRLRLVLDRVDQRPTAEGRVEALETLLEPTNIERLGSVAASRIAFDLGVLEMRIGDLDAAATRIVQAVNLDPSYPQAAEMLAGLLRTASTSSLEEAELLAIALTASPLDGVIARRLGQLVLAEGAYRTAADILDLALILTSSDAPFLDELTGDRALALWADGRGAEALELLDRAHRVRQLVIRRQAAASGKLPDEVQEMVIPPTPSLALIEAAIKGRIGSDSERDAAVRSLFAAYRFDMSRNARLAELIEEDESLTEEQKQDRIAAIQKRILELIVDQAWARAWFGWTPPVVEGEAAPLSLTDLVDRAAAGGAIDESQRLVIEGWWAIHQDDFDRARTLLAPSAESSPYAAAGLALLDEIMGERQDAARGYLRTFREVPGRLVGLWCRSRLESLLGVSVPPPDQAMAMATLVSETLPDAVGRALRDPKHGVLSVQVEPVSLRTAAFEPLLVDVTITNVSGLDLAIGPDGPILPTLALIADAFDIPVDPGLLEPAYRRQTPVPLVLPIDRRFRLDSQDSLTTRVDLTATRLGRLLDLQSYLSGTIRLRGVANYSAAPQGGIDAGLFGREGRSPVFRVDGLQPPNAARLASMIERIRDPRTVEAAKDAAALLGITMVGPSLLSGDASQIQAAAIDATIAMSPVARAWVMTVVPGGDGAPARLVDALVADETLGLPIALARFSPTPSSAPIVRGLASANPRIRRMAEAARDFAVRIESLTEAQFRLGDGDADGE